MDLAKTLYVGLLGSGTYGKVHARVYNSDPRVTLKALWSPTPSRRQAAPQEFGCRAADDWRDIVGDKQIDCVAVATPDFAHTAYAVAALQWVSVQGENGRVDVVADTENLTVTGEEGLLATQAVEAVVRSYTENRPVTLDEIEQGAAWAAAGP